MDKKTRVGVLMGGLSAEREISLNTGQAILRALQKKGYNAFPIDVGRDIAQVLTKEKVEVAFLALHGRYGEDGTLQGLLEILQIPYTGPGHLASALAMDKIKTKEVLSFHGLPTARFRIILRDSVEKVDPESLHLSFPVVVKAALEGSSIGVSFVEKAEYLAAALKGSARYDRKILVEEYIDGREVTVAILDGQILATVEVAPKGGFYDIKSKYTKGETEYFVPARLSPEEMSESHRLALATCEALGCISTSRVDIIFSPERGPFILEVNALPGMTETSLYPNPTSTV